MGGFAPYTISVAVPAEGGQMVEAEEFQKEESWENEEPVFGKREA